MRWHHIIGVCLDVCNPSSHVLKRLLGSEALESQEVLVVSSRALGSEALTGQEVQKLISSCSQALIMQVLNTADSVS